MLLKINFSIDKPIYQQVKEQIIEGIASGKLENGESLPSIRQLATDIGINMHTVNKVYAQLKNEGYISIHKRSGVMVNTVNLQSGKKYVEELEEKIKPIIAESICHGLTKERFKEITSALFQHLHPELAS